MVSSLMILQPCWRPITFSLKLELHFKSKTGKYELYEDGAVGRKIGSIKGRKISCINFLEVGNWFLEYEEGKKTLEELFSI